MSQILKLLRFYFVLLALFTVGRWSMGMAGVPYEKGHHIFSLVTLAFLASAHHAAFSRGFLGWRIGRAMGIGLTIGLVTQSVVFLSTAISYLADIHSYFNYPTALNVKEAIPFATAMMTRTAGLVFNSLFNSIAAAIGWLMGGVLPKREDLV